MIKKKKEEENEKSVTESFLGSIPLFGSFLKELSKTEAFKEKIKETDEKIKENLRKGHPKKWSFESHVSVRPIMSEIKKETSELSIHEDHFYGRKGNKLTLAVKVPKEDVNWKIEGKNILITADNFQKEIPLPDYFKKVEKKQYKNDILVFELTK